MNFQTKRTGRALALTAALVVALAPVLAEARASRGSSVGSRGSQTHTAPSATPTAPGQAQQFNRTAGPSQAAPATAAARPGAPAQSGGLFSSPIARGLMAGLVGAGLFGLLSGSGLFNGLGGLASMLGLLLQLALIGGLVWLAVSWWRRRQQPAEAVSGYGRAAPLSGADPRDNYAREQAAPAAGAAAGLGSGLGSSYGGGFGSQTRPLKLDEGDFNAFEKLLDEVQRAYAAEDFGHLRRISTPEMFGYFQEDIEEQQRNGVIAKSAGVKLLQGDLSEAWAEASGEYATVAMRYEMVDALVERDTGKLVEGDLTKPQEITELWTFVRGHGAGPQGWTLSAIQQTA